MAQGKIRRLSEFCPLDLFSEDAGRMRRALLALLAEPQNNLRLFRNGLPLQFTYVFVTPLQGALCPHCKAGIGYWLD